jgi:hypothetical protein
MRPRFGLAEERRTARSAEPSPHAIPAVRDAEVFSGFSSAGEARRTKARIHGPAARTKVLAVAAPAHSSHYRQLRTCPANQAAKTFTRYRHVINSRSATLGRMIAGHSAISKPSAIGCSSGGDAQPLYRADVPKAASRPLARRSCRTLGHGRANLRAAKRRVGVWEAGVQLEEIEMLPSMNEHAGFAVLAAVLGLSGAVSVHAQSAQLPDALAAGWKGQTTCEKLHEDETYASFVASFRRT